MSQTANRTLAILDLVASSDSSLGLMEICAATQLDKSVVSRILASLTRSGFLQRSEATRRYSAGVRFVALSMSVAQRLGVPGLRSDLVRSLRDETGETVSVHLRVGNVRVCVDGAESGQALRRGLVLGDVVPLYAGPTGKVITAFLDAEEMEAVVAQFEGAGSDVDAFRHLLSAARRQGYLVVTSDRTPGVGAMSAPLFDKGGVMASITIAGPAERWSVPRMKAFVPSLLAAAQRITADLGGRFPVRTFAADPDEEVAR